MFHSIAPVLVVSSLASLAAPRGDEWPEYRGPGRDGASRAAAIPATWSESKNVRWKTAIHGRGWSSPVVSDGRIWLTTATPEGKRMSVLAVDFDSGRIVHDRVLFEIESPEHRNSLNSYASPSPVAADGRVYVHFGTYGTACLDAETGETLWERRDLVCDHIEGPGSSPILHDDRLYLNVDGGDVQYVVALHASSGETAWRTDRTAELAPLAPDFRKAYATPVIVTAQTEDGPREELVSTGAVATYGYDPATGEELWRVKHGGFSVASRAAVIGDRVIVSTGFMRPSLVAIRAGGSGDVTESRVLWRNNRGVATMPSPVVVDGRLFQVSDRGMASAVDLKTGETLWQERLGADHCASPIFAAERIYFFDREGKTTVVRPSAEFEKLGEMRLDAGFMASPAIVGDALVLRTETHLYRIEAPPEEGG